MEKRGFKATNCHSNKNKLRTRMPNPGGGGGLEFSGIKKDRRPEGDKKKEKNKDSLNKEGPR